MRINKNNYLGLGSLDLRSVRSANDASYCHPDYFLYVALQRAYMVYVKQMDKLKKTETKNNAKKNGSEVDRETPRMSTGSWEIK